MSEALAPAFVEVTASTASDRSDPARPAVPCRICVGVVTLELADVPAPSWLVEVAAAAATLPC